MLHKNILDTDKAEFYTVTHVVKDGEIYQIYPEAGKFGNFILLSDDNDPIRLSADELDEQGYVPIEFCRTVELDEDLVPLNDVDKLAQLRYETKNRLDDSTHT